LIIGLKRTQVLDIVSKTHAYAFFMTPQSTDKHGWQQMRSEGKQDQVFDPFRRSKGFEEKMHHVLDVACWVSTRNTFKRPSIREVVG